MPVVTAAIRVETAEESALFNGFLYPLKAADSAFLFAEKHGVVLVGCIVHGAYKIPLLARDPFVRTGILMDHHARKGRCFAALTVDSFEF